MTMNRNQYPCVEFDLDKLAANLAALVERCHDSLIEVAGVVKAVSSLPEIVRVYEESGVKFIATSRISQMRAIREAGICKKPLMLIRTPDAPPSSPTWWSCVTSACRVILSCCVR